MTVLEIIDRIETGKKAARIFPFHATLREVATMHGNREHVRRELNRLYAEGMIIAGQTANDKYVYVVGRSYE
ncbi:MAG: hypothetical protein LBJ17_08645 [Dysgonamonadaceae bacterium]|jgi:hypothetical protein|nr:hypothetical protein [Dysgonamonadaceae bacterium]